MYPDQFFSGYILFYLFLFFYLFLLFYLLLLFCFFPVHRSANNRTSVLERFFQFHPCMAEVLLEC